MRNWTSMPAALRRGLVRWLAFGFACWGGTAAYSASLLTPGTVLDLSFIGAPPGFYFGGAVAVENDTAVVGGLPLGGNGLLFTYKNSGGTWTFDTELDVLANPAGLGYAIALSGDTLAVQSRLSYKTPTTAINIFARSAGVWSLQYTLTQDNWPIAGVTCIALSGDTLCLGTPSGTPAPRAPREKAVKCGQVDVFVRSGSVWTYQQTLSPSNPGANQAFGSSLALDGSRLAVGSPNAYAYGPQEGSCYVFTLAKGQWTQTAELVDTTGAGSRHLFGNSVALSGNCLLAGSLGRGQIVGSPTRPDGVVKGTVCAFHLNAKGTWDSEGVLPAPLADPDPTVASNPQNLGARIALSGSLAVVSNPTGKVNSERSYVYQRRGGHWVQLTPVVDNGFDASSWDPTTYDPLNPPLFNLLSSPGGVAAISGRTILIGAPNDTVQGQVRSGSAYFYSYASSLAAFDGATLNAQELAPGTLGDPVTVQLNDLVVNRTYARSYTIQNTGTEVLTGLAFTIDNTDVTISVPSMTTLAPLDSVTVKLTITPSTNGAWTANLSLNAKSSVDAPSLTLSLQSNVDDGPVNPVISTDPVSALLLEGTSYDLSAAVTGTEPLAYQWYHDGKPCPGCTSAVMSLTPLTFAEAGTYELKVTNAAGGAFSGAAQITVYSVQAARAFKATENSRVELDALVVDSSVNGAVAAKLNLPVTSPNYSVGWLFNGSTLSDNAVYSGTASPKLVIGSVSTATAGRYTAILNPTDPTDPNVNITIGTWNMGVTLLPVIQSNVASLTTLSVTSPVTFHFLSSPAAGGFSFQGVPPGLVANPATGTLTGTPTQPGKYTLQVAGVNAAGQGPATTVVLNVQGLDSRAVGTCQGIIARGSGNSGLGGTVTLTTSANGLCTGSATAGTRIVRFSSQMGLKLDGTPYETTFQATTAGVTDSYVLDIDPATGKLTGQFVSSLSTDVGSVITGWINPWSAGQPASLWGDYLTIGLSPGVGLDPATQPAGDSFGTATVSRTGVVTWAGRMADGSVTTATSLISGTQTTAGKPDHVEIPLNFLLSAGQGSAQGLLLLSQSNAPLPAYHGVGGTLDWFRMPVAGRSYAAGIALHALNATGGHYSPPANGGVALGLPVAISNAQMILAGAGIESSYQYLLVSQPFTITIKGLVLFSKPDPLSNTFSLDMAKGLFSGSLRISDPNPAKPTTNVYRTINTYGVLLKNVGTGFFTVPDLPDPTAKPPTTVNTSPVESGSLVLRQAN